MDLYAYIQKDEELINKYIDEQAVYELIIRGSMNKEQQIKKLAEEIYRAGVALDGSDFAHKSDHFERLAGELYKAGYRKQSETAQEFAEQLKKELFVNCTIIRTIYNPQKIEDMDSSEAFRIIDELTEQYGKEEV